MSEHAHGDTMSAGPGDPARLAAVHRVAAEQGAPAVLVSVHGEPTLAWLNTAAAELLTVDPDAVLRRPLGHAGQPPQQADTLDWRTVVADLVRRGGGQADAVVRRADHAVTQVWVRVGAVPQVCDEHPCWLVHLTGADADLVAARQAALEAEHRFEALARRAPVGIFVSEVGLRLGYVNEAFAAMSGRPAQALRGTGWLDLVHPQDAPALYECVETVLGGRPADLTVRILPVADGQRWVQVRFAPVTTPRRSAGFIGTIEDITARRAWEEQLAYQATHDPLTGLANRRRLIDTLSSLLEGRRAADRRFAVLFCDLDGFKAVNDTLGHDAGDRVLIEVAKRLSATARDRDLVARVAGDEFVVVLHGLVDTVDAETAARRHQSALDGVVFVSGKDVRLSASLGVAFPADGDTPESLLRAADRVMYQAKASGEGLLRLADPPPEPAQPAPVRPGRAPSQRGRTEGGR